MLCRQCGMRNEEGSRFCESCGFKLVGSKQERPNVGRENPRRRKPPSDSMASRQRRPVSEVRRVRENDDTEIIGQDREFNDSRELRRRTYDDDELSTGYQDSANRKNNRNKRKRKLILIGLGALLLVAILLAGWVFMGVQTTRAFNDAIDEGNRYLLAENLEQAEAHFLRAIEINPREVEPYLQLAEIYMTWDEPEEAIAILEQGLEVVPEEDRPALEEALDEIHESIGTEPPAVEVVEDEPEDEEIDPFYLALIAFHEFLSNPQSMMFYPNPDVPNARSYYLSWNRDTIRHAELIDLRGDGIPQLLLAPPPSEEMWAMVPVLIFEYIDGQVEVLYQSIHHSDGGIAGSYELGFTAEGKTYWIKIHQMGGVTNQKESDYLTLEGHEFVPVLNTRIYNSSFEEINGVWTPVIDSAYVNGQSVSVADFERVSYETLGIIEIRQFMPVFGEVNDIGELLLYIEGRLEAAGIDLAEHRNNEEEGGVDEEAENPTDNMAVEDTGEWAHGKANEITSQLEALGWENVLFAPGDGSVFYSKIIADYQGVANVMIHVRGYNDFWMMYESNIGEGAHGRRRHETSEFAELHLISPLEVVELHMSRWQ